MRVWLLTCLLLFALVQFYEWAKGFILPLPIYVLAGAFLSIASNYDQRMGSLFSQSMSHSIVSPQTANFSENEPAIEVQTSELQD